MSVGEIYIGQTQCNCIQWINKSKKSPHSEVRKQASRILIIK